MVPGPPLAHPWYTWIFSILSSSQCKCLMPLHLLEIKLTKWPNDINIKRTTPENTPIDLCVLPHIYKWQLSRCALTSHLQCVISSEIELTSWMAASWCNSVWVAIMRNGHAVKHRYSAVTGGEGGLWASDIFIYNDKGWQMYSSPLSGHNEQTEDKWSGTDGELLWKTKEEAKKAFFSYWLGLLDVQQLSEWP